MSKRFFAIALLILTVLSTVACVKSDITSDSDSTSDSGLGSGSGLESVPVPEFIATIPPEELDFTDPAEETTSEGQE
ncbi:MAG: hypothetical protein IKM33_05480 [Clostridia bacterium]|nr:hypothetical protein [Clostridia bacterium]